MAPEREYNQYPVPAIAQEYKASQASYVRTVDTPAAFDPLHLTEGQTPDGPPEEFVPIMNGLVDSGIWGKVEAYYNKIDNEPPAAQHVRERFGISNDPIISFDGNGSNGILIRLPRVLHRPKTNTLWWGIGPQFTTIPTAIKELNQLGAKIKYRPIVSDIYQGTESGLQPTMDLRKETTIRRRYRDLVVYVCNPGNPLGDVIPHERMEQLVSFFADRGDVVVIDEAFADALPDEESAIRFTDKYPNVIVTRSLSKMMGLAGARIGYSVASKELGNVYKDKLEPYHISGGQMALADGIMENNIMQKHLEKVKPSTIQRKTNFMHSLDQAGIKYLPTDMRTPILMANGESPLFCDLVIEGDLVGARGSDFAISHDDNIMDDRFVRFTHPKDEQELYSTIIRTSSAKHRSHLEIENSKTRKY